MLECNGQKVREVVRANRQGLDTHRVNVCLNAATHAVLLYHRLKRIGNAAGPKIHTENYHIGHMFQNKTTCMMDCTYKYVCSEAIITRNTLCSQWRLIIRLIRPCIKRGRRQRRRVENKKLVQKLLSFPFSLPFYGDYLHFYCAYTRLQNDT